MQGSRWPLVTLVRIGGLGGPNPTFRSTAEGGYVAPNMESGIYTPLIDGN